MGRSFQTAVIKNGQSLQDITSPNTAIVVGDGRIVGISMDQVGWDAAAITLVQQMPDGTWQKVVDEAGAEVSLAAVAGGNVYMAIKDTQRALVGLGTVRLRSGTAGVPVNQTADRTTRVAIIIDSD